MRMIKKTNWDKDQVAPFDPNTGSLLYFPTDSPDILWLDVSEPFHAKLQCRGLSCTRIKSKRFRTVRFYWYDLDSSAMHQMFVKDFYELWDLGLLGNPNKIISGWWKVVKKGRNYGIRFHSKKKDKEAEQKTIEES